MELIVLVLLVLVLGVLIGAAIAPVALARANAAGRALVGAERRIDALRTQVDRLQARLNAIALVREQPQPQANQDSATATVTPTVQDPPAAVRGEREHRVDEEAVEPAQADKEEVVDSQHGSTAQPAADATPTVDRAAEANEAAGNLADQVQQAEAEPTADADLSGTLHALRSKQQRRHEAEEKPADATTTEAAEQSAEPVVQAYVPRESVVEPGPSEEGVATRSVQRLSIEEVLAGKVFVWIGAVALVLTAAFLLKLGFDSGLINEPVRVIAAAVFGVVLWAAGEWARARAALVAQALCGAGVAVLYASVLAAHSLYGLLGPSGEAIAFGLMATITAAAILLSLRHGPAVAILGMLGGFMLPPVLTQGLGGPTAGMILYLLAIEVGVLAVTGKRGWFGISLMTLIFSVVWSLGYTLIGDNPHERTLTAMLVIGTAAAYLFHTARIHRDPSPAITASTRKRALLLSIAATCSAIGVVALLAVTGDYALQDLGMLGLVAAGTLILARLDARQIAMPFVAMGLSGLVLVSDAVRALPGLPSGTLIVMSACFGGLFVVGGYACLWGSERRRAFAVLSTIAGPAFYGLVVYAGHEAYGLRDMWWPYTLGLAGLYAVMAVPMLMRRRAEHDWPIALFAVLSFGLVCVTLGQSLNHPYFAVSLALVAMAAALLDLRLFIRPLGVAGSAVAWVSAVLLVAPGPFDLTIQGIAVFNTLLPMYLLPAIAFGVMAWSVKCSGNREAAQHLTWLCVGTLTAMLLVLTRQIYQPDHFTAEVFNLYEWSTYASVLLIAAYAGRWVGGRLGGRLGYAPISSALRRVVGLGALIALVAGLVASNPLLRPDTPGGLSLMFGLLALYALPAALLWHNSRSPAITPYPPLTHTLRVIALILAALFIALQVRNGFHFNSDALQGPAIGLYECITYATAWLLLGGFIQRFNQRQTPSTATRIVGQAIFLVGLATTLIGSLVIFNPLIDQSAVGGWQLIMPLAVLYVLPAALLWLWSRGQTMADQPTLVSALRSLSVAYLAIFIAQLIRNGFHHEHLHALQLGMFECATYGLAWLVFGFALQQIAKRCTLEPTTRNTGRVVFGLGLATLLIGNVVALNPLWTDESLGRAPVFNGLWYLFGPLILTLSLLARHARTQQHKAHAQLAGYTAIALGFMLLSTLVRHGFSGNGLAVITGNLADAERYAYSLAWVLYGAALLLAGVFTRLDTLRYASLAVLLVAVGKVFLIDTANLDNLYRVFSFFGLGVTLIGLGYLYQRLVFRRPKPLTNGATT